jgi:hypothetical protein
MSTTFKHKLIADARPLGVDAAIADEVETIVCDAEKKLRRLYTRRAPSAFAAESMIMRLHNRLVNFSRSCVVSLSP